MRDEAKRALAAFGRLTSRARVLPDYLVLGTQRGGTTSLYKYLVRHPSHAHAITKELRFFDLNYGRGIEWYRSCFPTSVYRTLVEWSGRGHLVAGEASPDYLFYPTVPDRVAHHLPHARFVVLLRDPVERAYSHYWHQRSRGHETLSFEEAIEREPERLGAELERLGGDPDAARYAFHHHSYATRGLYADQLERWFQRFDRRRFLIERSEDLFADPDAVVRRVQAFLGLPARSLGPYEVFNRYALGTMTPATRDRLEAFFEPANARLGDLLGRDMSWSS